MKAIIKATGEIVDVEVHGWNANNEPILYHHNHTKFYKPEDYNVRYITMGRVQDRRCYL